MEKKDLSPGDPVYYFPDRSRNPHHFFRASIVKDVGYCDCCGQVVYKIIDALGSAHRAIRGQLQFISGSSELIQLTA